MADDVEVVYTKYITLKNGKRIYASSYGLTAFRLEIRKKQGKSGGRARRKA